MPYLIPLCFAPAIGLVVGTASAAFLAALDRAVAFGEARPFTICLLPLAGLLVGWLYHRFGPGLARGTDLILDEIHGPRAPVPLRLVPLVFVGTVLTHLFGGSAGREGTAVQMGAALADEVARRSGLGHRHRPALLAAGIAAGFGSVFGVPWAGALFGIEVPAVGRWRLRDLPACALASWVGHLTTVTWGIRHAAYAAPVTPPWGGATLGWVAVGGVLFGLCANGFAVLSHGVSTVFTRAVRFAPLRPAVGGTLVLLTYAGLGTTRYARLGLDVIAASARVAAPATDALFKMVTTALTLGSGFRGGEVTPLLFVGATLGSWASTWIPLDVSTLAALGLVAVFAGAANTPVACAAMAAELFGAPIGPWALVACGISAACSGSSGIYAGQRGRERKALRPYFGRLYMAIARSRRSE